MTTQTNKQRAVICPYCGYKMPIRYDDTANASGVYITCKGRGCRRSFEIKLAAGQQIDIDK